MKPGRQLPFVENKDKLIEIALICDAWHIRPSDYIGLRLEGNRQDFDRAVNYALRIYQTEKSGKSRRDLLIGINLANMLAFNGKALEFNDQEFFDPDVHDSFQTAGGTSRKRHKSEYVEQDGAGRATERQVAAWRAQGCEVW